MTKKERKKKFIGFFREGRGNVSYACRRLNISRACFYKWTEEDEKFKKECEDIKEETTDDVESKLLAAINEGNITAIIFYLKTKGKNRGYIEKIEQEVNVNQFEQLMKELPDDEE